MREAATEKILEDTKKAYELDPESDTAYIAMADRLMATGDLAGAESHLKEGFEKHRESVSTYILLSEVARRQGKLEEAKQHIEDGLSLSNQDLGLLFLRGNCEIDLGLLAEARQTLVRLEQLLGPRNYQIPLLELIRARLAMSDGNYLKAAPILEKLKLTPPSSAIYNLRARYIPQYLRDCYIQTGQSHMAKQMMQQTGSPLNAKFAEAQTHGPARPSTMMHSGYFSSSARTRSLTEYGQELVFSSILNIQIQRQLQRPDAERDWSAVQKMASSWLKREGISEVEKELFQTAVTEQHESTETKLVEKSNRCC